MPFGEWVEGHVQGIWWFVEGLSVTGFLSVLIVYFIIKRRLKRSRQGASAKRDSAQ